MRRASGMLIPIALLFAVSGCGGDDNSNKLPPNASTIEYAKESQDKMAGMYGTPKPEKAQSNSASDMMRNYKNKK